MADDKQLGRPTLYTKDLADEIIQRIVEGESLRRICNDDHVPTKGAVLGWVAEEREDFSDRYIKAMNIRAHGWADEMMDIADDAANDYMESLDKNGDEYLKLNSEHINRSRLRIDTRKFMLSKLLPQKYGDKIEPESEDAQSITSITYEEIDARKSQ